ncbi:MAG TPA: cyclopropane-fatty-acyl-phospholipid synthase family protein [Dokdonella sp.]|nr:cyclopropane-fatty-acyl-phospholipid synthase family protein [Dokdonella sp.]
MTTKGHSNPIRREAPPHEAESLLTRWAESGRIPDTLLRLGIRRMCAARLRDEMAGGVEATAERQRKRIDELRGSPIAIETDAANAQHYELPPPFFRLCLGSHLKYSACYWDETTPDLDAAEARMLGLCGERAELADGQRILELGCGWGSLTLWMAARFPQARITAVSNSRPQREFIQARCRERNLANVEVITTDVNHLELDASQFDRVVSIEMFEHMRNYEHLLERVGSWLRPGGKLFVHIFCHRTLAYPFETRGGDNWMGRHFFTGGLMPAADTLLHFQRDIAIEERWLLPGTHYEKTANAWLENQDRNRGEILRILAEAYGTDQARLWHQRWRMFWMACAELFGYANGAEWMVAHYRFARRA